MSSALPHCVTKSTSYTCCRRVSIVWVTSQMIHTLLLRLCWADIWVPECYIYCVTTETKWFIIQWAYEWKKKRATQGLLSNKAWQCQTAFWFKMFDGLSTYVHCFLWLLGWYCKHHRHRINMIIHSICVGVHLFGFPPGFSALGLMLNKDSDRTMSSSQIE